MIILIFHVNGFSQKIHLIGQQNTVNPVDLIGVIGNIFNKRLPERSDIIIPGVNNVSLLPIIGYGPANGFVLAPPSVQRTYWETK